MSRVPHALLALSLSLWCATPALAAGKARGDAGIKEAAGLCAAPTSAVAFSCKTRDNALVAVCSREDGALQLVFQKAGAADGRVVLPASPDEKRGVVVGSLMYSGGGGSYGRFKAGQGKEYVVYSGFGKGWAQAGLSEVRGEAHLAEHVCLPATKPYDIGFPLLGEKAGYAMDENEGFAIDVQ